METVTISAPISNREAYIPSYLKCILSQTYPKELTNLYFLINNSQDNSQTLLKQFKKKYQISYNKIDVKIYNNSKIPSSKDRLNRIIDNSLYEHLAYIRNLIFESIDTDWVFSVDSDIMLTPDSLDTLIKSGKKAISGLVCNGHEFVKSSPFTDPYKFTNVMYLNNLHKYTHFRKSQLKGIIEVDMTGAIILLHRSLYKTCKYRSDNQGEDIPFCQDIQKLKEKIYCNTDVKLAHCMNLELLENFKNNKFKY